MQMNRSEKVLLTLYRLSQDSDRSIQYEDLVVAAYKAFPEDFSLRGYPEYPDASDIHKPIYNYLKPRGLVRVANKNFKLTEAGRRTAQSLIQASTATERHRLTRHQEMAVERHLRSAAVMLVDKGELDQLIDTDCQRFYGFAPWTKPKEASALREELLDLLDALKFINADKAGLLLRADLALYGRFRHLFEEAQHANRA